MNLVDRDAIVTREGLIFRVLGYSHPRDSYFCDLEYAPSRIFGSRNPKSPRGEVETTHSKFYENEAWEFLRAQYPEYLIEHKALGTRVVGVRRAQIKETRKPEDALRRLMDLEPGDALIESMQKVVAIVEQRFGIGSGHLGVFGSLLHGFHHPDLSDIDLTVYGRENVQKLLHALSGAYRVTDFTLHNEFENRPSIVTKKWKFLNYAAEEYFWHQRRKLIYAIYQSQENGRSVKVEFEPVKSRIEVVNDYDEQTKIKRKGWARIIAKVSSDEDSPFIPSLYGLEPEEVVDGPREARDVERVVSYMEEFRLQAVAGERIYVEGNLEEVVSPRGSHLQIALTYCPRYYEQVLKKCDRV